MGYNSLVTKYKNQVKKFCIDELKNVLSENVYWKNVENRQPADLAAAVDYVVTNVSETKINSITHKVLGISCYKELRKEAPYLTDLLPDTSKLFNEKFSQYMKMYLGRNVYNNFFMKMKQTHFAPKKFKNQIVY